MTDGYPRFYREFLQMGPKALLPKRWATAIARKAGLRNGALVDGGPDAGGIFTDTNDAAGFVVELAGGGQVFPGIGSMTRLTDETGKAEERFLVNVASAGPSGSYLQARDLSVELDVAGINVSDWGALGSGEIGWTAHSPEAGSVTIGLVQRQTR